MFKNHFLAVAAKAFSINLREGIFGRCFQEQVIPYWTISMGCLLPCQCSFPMDGDSLLPARDRLASYHYGKTGCYLVTQGDAFLFLFLKAPFMLQNKVGLLRWEGGEGRIGSHSCSYFDSITGIPPNPEECLRADTESGSNNSHSSVPQFPLIIKSFWVKMGPETPLLSRMQTNTLPPTGSGPLPPTGNKVWATDAR